MNNLTTNGNMVVVNGEGYPKNKLRYRVNQAGEIAIIYEDRAIIPFNPYSAYTIDGEVIETAQILLEWIGENFSSAPAFGGGLPNPLPDGTFIIGTGEIPEVRRLNNADFDIEESVVGTYATPIWNLLENKWEVGGFEVTSEKAENTIPIKGKDGELTVGVATKADSAIQYAQKHGIINNTLNGTEGRINLDQLYPDAIPGGFEVVSQTYKVCYKKLLSGAWAKINFDDILT